MFGLAIALSILGIAVGPTLLVFGRGRAGVHATADGFVWGLLPTLIALRILPHLYAQLGPKAVVFLAAGYLGFWVVSHSRRGLPLATSLAVGTLAVHSLVDGASIAVASHSGGGALPLTFGLASHRLPEGFAIGTLLLPRLGVRTTAAVMALLAASTALGAVAGQNLLTHLDDVLLHSVVAVGMGTMLRVGLHRHARSPRRSDVALGALGFVVGVLLAVVAPVADRDESAMGSQSPR